MSTFRCSICPKRHRVNSLIGKAHLRFTVEDARRACGPCTRPYCGAHSPIALSA